MPNDAGADDSPAGSRFYEVNPEDPDAPRMLNEYKGIRPGDEVVYRRRPAVGDITGRLVVTELIEFGATDEWPDGWVIAVLNDGEYEFDADNLRKAPKRKGK